MSGTPDIHFDALRGWFRFTPTGRIRPIKGEPFTSREQAIAYALEQLKGVADRSIYAASVNARKALEWATN